MVFAPALTYGRYIIRADAITAIGERTDAIGPDCTYVVVGGQRARLVIGQVDDVLARVVRALPYCSRPRVADIEPPDELDEEAEPAAPVDGITPADP